jgi:hypothetical protein
MSNDIEAAINLPIERSVGLDWNMVELYQTFKRRPIPSHIHSSIKQKEKEFFQTHAMNIVLA